MSWCVWCVDALMTVLLCWWTHMDTHGHCSCTGFWEA
jgi:hypothetical protein